MDLNAGVSVPGTFTVWSVNAISAGRMRVAIGEGRFCGQVPCLHITPCVALNDCYFINTGLYGNTHNKT